MHITVEPCHNRSIAGRQINHADGIADTVSTAGLCGVNNGVLPVSRHAESIFQVDGSPLFGCTVHDLKGSTGAFICQEAGIIRRQHAFQDKSIIRIFG